MYDHVYLQTWTQGMNRRYWTVRKNGTTRRPVLRRATDAQVQSVQEREQKHWEGQEQLQQYKDIETIEPTLAATGPWIERTRWLETYRGIRRDVLLSLCQMPSLHRSRHNYIMGRSLQAEDGEESVDLVSAWDYEQRIAALMPVIDDMLDRCEETVQHTSRVLLRWL